MTPFYMAMVDRAYSCLKCNVIYETPEKAVGNIVENSAPEQSSPANAKPTEDFPVQEVSIEDKAMLYKELNKSRTKESITHVSNPYQ